jgi:cytochrome c oxidase assembly protein subunit 15
MDYDCWDAKSSSNVRKIAVKDMAQQSLSGRGRPLTRVVDDLHHHFGALVIAASIVTFLMIVVGAITRTSNSGMGCGTYWPLCNGQIVPEFTSTEVMIEFGHRLFALLVAVFVGLVAVVAFTRRRGERFVPALATAGIVLYFLQAGLGAITVALSNQWVSVMLHLMNSMLLLATYLALAVVVYQPSAQRNAEPNPIPFTELLITALLAFLVAIVGAGVAGNGAAKACVGWPLCRGELWPAEQGPFQMINMLHRLVAGGLGIMLLILIVQVWNSRGTTPARLRAALYWAAGLYLAQALLGVLIVLLNGPEISFVVRSLHVAFAAATWSAMVIASGLGWLQEREPLMNRAGGAVRSATTSS